MVGFGIFFQKIYVGNLSNIDEIAILRLTFNKAEGFIVGCFQCNSTMPLMGDNGLFGFWNID